MSDSPFEYDESLVSSCSSSSLASFASGSFLGKTIGALEGQDRACQTLFVQHASHYGRPLSEEDASIGPPGKEYRLSRRLQKFVSSVILVHRHNQKLQNGSTQRHRIGLNQFSDLDDHELPFSHMEDIVALDSLWTGDHDETTEDLFDGMSTSFVRLEDEQSIMDVASDFEQMVGSSHKNKNHNRKTHRRRHHKRKNGSLAPSDHTFPTLKVAEDLDVNDFSVDKGKNDHSPYTTGSADDADHDFETYLNWATEDNPDSVRIVHPVMDQGACGSCWAFAATGTLEASASRRAAYQTFTTLMQKGGSGNGQELHDNAVLGAQESERNTLGIANLSVQELVDCDTAVDQGCTGGNPLLAFYFVHRFGLTSWANYPYIGEQGMCRAHRVAQPIATVQSWGILTPNHEANMELVLRYIGPIAVGINGAEPTFLAYKGGVYESGECGQAANHALLIVGLGEEKNETNGSVVKYWIARNTWGVGWGEQGYIRVKRGDGAKGKPGVCGLAKNPSVALGGMLLESSDLRSDLKWKNYVRRSHHSQQLERSQMYDSCSGLRFDEISPVLRLECMLHYHRAAVYGFTSLIAVALFVVWPLTSECRSRRQRRQRRLEQERLEAMASSPKEASPLVESDLSQTNYGSSTI